MTKLHPDFHDPDANAKRLAELRELNEEAQRVRRERIAKARPTGFAALAKSVYAARARSADEGDDDNA